MRAGTAIPLVLLIPLLGVAPANAAMVAVQPVGENEELFYEAEEGEANELTASTDGSVVTFEDPGAVMQPGTDCDSVSDHVATCNFNGFAPVHANLRNEADSARIDGAMILLTGDGGGGADRLIGADLPDSLDGGHGSDVLKGRGALDLVSYDDRADDLRVTLGDGIRNDGGPQDGALRDRLVGIERVSGGEGDDELVGAAGRTGSSARTVATS